MWCLSNSYANTNQLIRWVCSRIRLVKNPPAAKKPRSYHVIPFSLATEGFRWRTLTVLCKMYGTPENPKASARPSSFQNFNFHRAFSRFINMLKYSPQCIESKYSIRIFNSGFGHGDI